MADITAPSAQKALRCELIAKGESQPEFIATHCGSTASLSERFARELEGGPALPADLVSELAAEPLAIALWLTNLRYKFFLKGATNDLYSLCVSKDSRNGAIWNGGSWRILLKKSLSAPVRNFLASLVCLAHSDLRDRIASRKIDHGSSRVGRSSVQRRMRLNAGFGKIFEVDQFSTFSTVSAPSGHRDLFPENSPHAASNLVHSSVFRIPS
ncbi:hypothetical protein [Tardiphaga sp. vice154]|uniref:hypothetical protein n=1 Tax=Tardiphaga sp. vice154 TaxID=2592814 RepID=UPI001AEEB859|nr:hypothetical protein [Tardiphaga sp. vice154]